jgi:hypothetical protein
MEIPEVLEGIISVLEQNISTLKKSQKRRLKHVGPKLTSFIEKAMEVRANMPNYAPGHITDEKLKSSYQEFKAYRLIKDNLAKVSSLVAKNAVFVDDALCDYSLSLSNALKDGAKRGDVKAASFYADLCSHSPYKGRIKAPVPASA